MLNIKELADEALRFYDSIPLLQALTNDDFTNMLIEDLGKISLIISDADDEITEEEKLVLVFFTTMIIKGRSSYDILSSPVLLNKSNQLKLIEPTNELINNVRFIKGINFLKSTIFMKEVDKKMGGDNFQKISDAFYRFAQILAKADGMVSQKEEEVLKRVRKLLQADLSMVKITNAQTYEEFKAASGATDGLDALLNEWSSIIKKTKKGSKK